ncbi:MAG: carbohydrate ABC transporter permease [bacterium]
MLFDDKLFWQALKVTSIYTVFSVTLGITAALLVSILMNQCVPGIVIFRTIFYSPAVVSGVSVALLWMWIFNPDFGILNYLLWAIFRIKGPAWIYSEEWALPSYILMSLWSIGGGMIVFLAGLQGIPTQLYEAADVDGANVFQKFFYITLPMISPIIFFNLIMGIIGSFQVFTQIFVMTNGYGGPHYAALVYVLYLYQNGFKYFKMGYASALAWVLFLIILIVTLLAFKSSPMWVYYEGRMRGR